MVVFATCSFLHQSASLCCIFISDRLLCLMSKPQRYLPMAGKVRKFGPRLTVSLTGQDYDDLSALADKDDVSVSWVVRRAIDEYLDHHRHEVEPALPLRHLQKAERYALQADEKQ